VARETEADPDDDQNSPGWLVDDVSPGKSPTATLLFAHGASAAMDSQGMSRLAVAIAANGVRVVRFEFPYMAARRLSGKRTPPPRADKLIDAYASALAEVAEEYSDAPIYIGGKSMGGRVATMLAARGSHTEQIKGVVVVGYPFHPPASPEKLRTEHLQSFPCPLLICQGTRDPFGTQAEVSGYALGQEATVTWFADGDHDLKPRVKSGETWRGHIEGVGAAVGALVAQRSA